MLLKLQEIQCFFVAKITMQILVYIFCLKLASSQLIVPKFQIFSPNKLAVAVPQPLKEELIHCRMGVTKKLSNILDIECNPTKNQIYINDERLNLQKEDVLKYVLVFKNSTDYTVNSGSYKFDGVYVKRSFRVKSRTRRQNFLTSEDWVWDTSNLNPTVENVRTENKYNHHASEEENEVFDFNHNDPNSHESFELIDKHVDHQFGYKPSQESWNSEISQDSNLLISSESSVPNYNSDETNEENESENKNLVHQSDHTFSLGSWNQGVLPDSKPIILSGSSVPPISSSKPEILAKTTIKPPQEICCPCEQNAVAGETVTPIVVESSTMLPVYDMDIRSLFKKNEKL